MIIRCGATPGRRTLQPARLFAGTSSAVKSPITLTEYLLGAMTSIESELDSRGVAGHVTEVPFCATDLSDEITRKLKRERYAWLTTVAPSGVPAPMKPPNRMLIPSLKRGRKSAWLIRLLEMLILLLLRM